MGRKMKFIAIIIVAIVVCMGVVFCADSTAVVKHFTVKDINWIEVMKFAGIVLGGLGGVGASGITVIAILFAILRAIPNTVVDKWGDAWGVFLTKIGRQKLSELNVDTAETTYIRFQRATEGAMRRLNPDLPKIDNK